jgi:hypothetical protein
MAEGAIITSLCWVSRGFAKNVVEDYNPTKKEVEEYQMEGLKYSK